MFICAVYGKNLQFAVSSPGYVMMLEITYFSLKGNPYTPSSPLPGMRSFTVTVEKKADYKKVVIIFA